MSVIVKETAEYVEMSDSITLSIVKDGTAGTSINMKNGVASTSGLPSSGASMGDSYIIDGHLWTYTGATVSDSTHVNGFTDCGSIKGEQGESNYIHVAWCKESDFNTSTKKPNSESVIKLDNNNGVTYEYMGTWVSTTKNDTNAEAFSKATWVYIKGDKGNKGDNYTIVFAINGINAETLNFDDMCEMTDASLQADFFNQGVSVNIPHSTLTCYDADGNTLGSPIDVRATSNIIADGGNLYLSSSCKSIVVVAMDAKDSILVSKSLGVIRNTITYGLTKMSDTVATIKASDTTANATFKLSYLLHYKAVKMVGTVSHNAAIASIKATIENKEKTQTVNGLEGKMEGNGENTYDADHRDIANAIPVTITLADGTLLYDSVQIGMEAGVAIDINKNLGGIKQIVTDNQKNISTIDQKADNISLKVSNMDSGLKATGIDIDAKKVKFTGSQFLWQNNAGAKVAYIDDKGNACFSGTVTASSIISSTINGTTITGGTINGTTISGSTITSSDGKSTTKIESGQVTTNNLVANGGSIGGFNISQYQIGYDSIKNADNFAKQKEMSLYRDYIYFNSPRRRALLGCLMSMGQKMMESLQSYSYNTVADYGIVASIRNYANLGFGSNAVALHLNGCIEGLAVQTQEASKDCTIGKYTGSFLIIGAGTKYYLPDMEPWDEGHEIKIKRLVDHPAGVKPQDDWTVILNAGKYNEYKNTIYLGAEATNPVSASSKDVGYSATDYKNVAWTVVEKDGMKLFHHEWQTCLSVDQGLIQTDLGINSPGDAMTFIFHGALTTSKYSNCKGCWVQYKHPRDW